MKKHRIWFFVILIIACLIRFINIDSVPVGLNADEAYAGYEAWSIAETGADSHGYQSPVYFVSWGSGMNVLYSYLSIPAVKIFGLSTFSLRITQAIFGVATIIIIYLIIKKFLGQRKALIGTGLLAIIPWHIMLSRWGLESDILPFCLSLGILGFVYGIEKKPFLLLSALGFGLSLYSYAVAWAVVPFLVVGLVWHGIRTKKLQWNKWSIMSGCLLILMGLPLVLFLAVNAGLLPEIRTALISIPKMPAFGSGGYGANIFEHIGNLFSVIFSIKPDGYNAIGLHGLFFLPSLPLMLYGIWISFKKFFTNIKQRKWSLETVIAIWLLACIPMALLILDGNATRLNSLMLPLFLCIVVGLLELTREKPLSRILPVALTGYAVMAVFFLHDYSTNRAWNFPEVVSAIEATNGRDNEVYFDGQNFAQLLVAARPMITPEEAIIDNPDGTEWVNGRIDVQNIGRYHLQTKATDPIDPDGTYIIHTNNTEFEEALNLHGFSLIKETYDRKVFTINK
ncbi:glycosyltransferase family 39 protein [Christensenellaceae bacterium OttesenSCG-928-L17]|nr:glycosyltransferase family 39 protein [Christensenellaceae bacterium OttesenSCG-928-L17]